MTCTINGCLIPGAPHSHGVLNPLDHCPWCGGRIRDFMADGYEAEDGQRGHLSCRAANTVIRCPAIGCTFLHPNGHDEFDGECVRCGEWTTDGDRAEVVPGLVHAGCMLPGEEVA